PASAGNSFSRRDRPRRYRMGFYQSFSIGGEEGREPPRGDREAGTDFTSSREEPALAPRTGRNLAEGSRDASPEAKQDTVVEPDCAGRPRLVDPEIHDPVRRSRRRLLCGG